MRLHYKKQKYQEDAVNSIVNTFIGQPKQKPYEYLLKSFEKEQLNLLDMSGFKNHPIQLKENKLLYNINKVQKKNNLIMDSQLNKMLIGGKDNKSNIDNSKESLALTIEMETGTGKTYTYIKTIIELYNNYGWSKFIVVVPNIAIREGVAKSFEDLKEHFNLEYGVTIRSFIYNSKQLDKIEGFANDSGINVMIINTQAFNSTTKDARRIDMVLDSFQGRKPADVIASTNPIIIIDEPQSVLGQKGVNLNKTRIGLSKFNPLFFINFSATHRDKFNMIYRLDAIDAYQKKLVKKISVKGIELNESNNTSQFLYLENIKKGSSLKARIHFEKLTKDGNIVKISKLFSHNENIYDYTGGIKSYHKGYTISKINYDKQYVEFTNGEKLSVGEAKGDNSSDLRTIQIRETIKTHLEKEEYLFKRDIKCLSLFFIDEVVKYKDYNSEDNKGIYAKIFENEYKDIVQTYLDENNNIDNEYKDYLEQSLFALEKVHAGYFSQDKKGKLIDSKTKRNSESSDDISAYELIMKNKERLLSFKEQVRFIFSHSALKEGWDNPNIFQIATLRHSSSEIKKRQEIGRGLRLSVNQYGERQDMEELGIDEVQQINNLTIIANESYESFSKNLQSEMAESMKDRPLFIEPKLFEDYVLDSPSKDILPLKIDNSGAAEIWYNLKTYNIIDENNQIDVNFKSLSTSDKKIAIFECIKNTAYKEYSDDILNILDSVQNLDIDNERKKVNLKIADHKFNSDSFKNLWSKINLKTYYTVSFNEEEIIKDSIRELNNELIISKRNARITSGSMNINENNTIFNIESRQTEYVNQNDNNNTYDLLGEIARRVGLLRITIAKILSGIKEPVFNQYTLNPESFIVNSSEIINNIKAQKIIENITYNRLNEVWDENEIFLNSTIQGIEGKNIIDVKKHLYTKLKYDSIIEKEFAENLDVENDVEMYVKLPSIFYINTPMGKYNPDWAIILNKENNKHIYFIAETKGKEKNLSLELRGNEKAKIESAREHFKTISDNNVKYDVVTNYEGLLRKLLKE